MKQVPLSYFLSLIQSFAKHIRSIQKLIPLDAIYAKLLKVAYDIISKPLCAIFNISVITKHFPNKWKLANVTHVHKKKEDKNIIGNYLPISGRYIYMLQSKREISLECSDIIGSAKGSQISEKY
jgi:hypothetical protein